MKQNKQLSKKLITALFAAVFILSAVVFPAFIQDNKAEALSGSDFNPGRIIDDAVFNNHNSMSVTQIQNFLNARVPNCNPNSQMPCLKDYQQNVSAVTNGGSDLCKGSISAGTKSAARIIYDVSKACGINPQVLIVNLEKEQSLITSTSPTTYAYERAMGFGCPDSGPNLQRQL
jgi:hypothetical protein